MDAGERVEKVNTITATVKKDGKPDRKSPVGTSEKDFNRSGNPVRSITATFTAKSSPPAR